jgi:hypothetical protein
MDELGKKVAMHGEFWGEERAMCRSYIGPGEGLTSWREPGDRFAAAAAIESVTTRW